MGKTILVAALLAPFFARAENPALTELASKGYKFVMVMTKNDADLVLVNQDADGLKFIVGEASCQSSIASRKDPVYEGETLGVIKIECENHGVKTISSASCSPRYQEVQSHFEMKDAKDSYVIDLVCRARGT